MTYDIFKDSIPPNPEAVKVIETMPLWLRQLPTEPFDVDIQDLRVPIPKPYLP